MRSTVKVLSAIAALAMAAGLSACDEQGASQTSAGDATANDSADKGADATSSKDSKDSKGSEGKDGETTKSGSKIRNIEPVTFKDEQISLTQTCDKAIEDYPAPKFKQSTGGSDSGTAYLLHCTLEFSGDFGYSSTLSDSASLQDKGDSSLKADDYGSLLEDDMKDDGLKVLGSDDLGSRKVEGWFGFASAGQTAKLKPFSEGTTTIVYDRAAGKGIQSGKQYEAYTDTQDLVLK